MTVSHAVAFANSSALGGLSRGSGAPIAIHFSKSAITALLSFSRVPLRVATVSGALVSVLAFAYGAYAAAQRLVFERAIPGWTSLAILVSMLSGAQMLFLGLLGEYLGQVLDESKQRPIYVVREMSIPALQGAPARDERAG